MQHALDVILAFAQRHPQSALAFVGFIAFAESVAIIGTVVPAAVVMFAAGALAGHGVLSLPWVLAIATAGAIAGDAFSYELGRHQQQRVRSWHVLRPHAARIARAEAFIARHGGKSVLMARFTGAVRAFVPLLAGFARMPASTFYVTNVTSAMLWSASHILPGVVFGASLQLAEAASARLALLVLILAGLLWLAFWTASLVVRSLVPLGRRMRTHAARAVQRHDTAWLAPVRALLDPNRPGAQALLGGLFVLLGSIWLFLGVLEDVVSGDPLVVVDRNVFTFLQQLRTAPVDRWMVYITELGSVAVMLPLVAVMTGWLAWRRCWRTAGYWLVTVGSAEAVVLIMKQTLGRHRPLVLYEGVEQFSFPSGHATMTMVVLAYLAFLVARGGSRTWRIGVGATAAAYAVLVGFSRLYLGAHWLSDVLGGFGFGLTAVALSAVVYTQHPVHEAIAPRRMAGIAVLTIVAFGAAWSSWRAPADMRQYVSATPAQTTTADAWASGGFRLLPARRRELAGEEKEPFAFQIACPQGQLQQVLSAAGWRAGPPISMRTILLALAPHPALQDLPVLPKFDGGSRSRLNFTQAPAVLTTSRTVVRLWRSDWQLAGAHGVVPIWYGAFYEQAQVRPDFSWWRERGQPPEGFERTFERFDVQRLTPGPGNRTKAPVLLSCAAG